MLNYNGVPVSNENVFFPPFPEDKTRSNYCSPEFSYGAAFNLTTVVDHTFFDSVDGNDVVVAHMSHSTIV